MRHFLCNSCLLLASWDDVLFVLCRPVNLKLAKQGFLFEKPKHFHVNREILYRDRRLECTLLIYLLLNSSVFSTETMLSHGDLGDFEDVASYGASCLVSTNMLAQQHLL